MNTLNYDSKINGVVFAIGLGSTPTTPQWTFADDKKLFTDTDSYKQSSEFTVENKIQQVAFWPTNPHSFINVPQRFYLSVTGISTKLAINLDSSISSDDYYSYFTSGLSTIKPSNGDTMTFTSENTINPTIDNGSTQEITIKQLDLPSDVSCNYRTGTVFVNNTIVLNFTGNIKVGDAIVITRSKHNQINSNITTETKNMTGLFSVSAGETLSLVYTHKDATPTPTPTPKTVTYTSSDPNIKWTNSTTTNGTKISNTIQIAKGAYVVSKPDTFSLDVTYQDGTTKRINFQLEPNSYGKTYGDKTFTFPDLTNFKNVNIPNQSKLIQIKLLTKLQNCDITEPQAVNGVYYIDKDHLNVTLTAHDGYLFSSDGTLTISEILNTSKIVIKANNQKTITVTVPQVINTDTNNVTITMEAIKQDIIHTTGGFVNLYKADYSSLVKFSNDWISKTVSASGVSIYNVTSYISNLIMLPFDIPKQLINKPSGIIAGNQVYTTEMPTIDSNRYTYDLGNIKIAEQYKNAYDYYNVKTRLMLPYTDNVELDPKHVINHTISIKYNVDFQTGDTTVIIANENGTFLTNQVNISDNIPFITTSTNGNQYAVINQLKTKFNNEIKQAYILIEQPTPILNDEYYSTIERGILKAYNGNVKAEMLSNVSNIPSDELPLVQNILRNGVTIK